MDSKPSSEVSFELPTLFRIYNDGRTERLKGTETVPPSTDPTTGVQSKDIVLSPQSMLSARVFLPKLPDPTRPANSLSLFSSTAALSSSSPPTLLSTTTTSGYWLPKPTSWLCRCTIGVPRSTHSLLLLKNPKLGEIGCGRVLVFVAEKDFLRDRGWAY